MPRRSTSTRAGTRRSYRASRPTCASRPRRAPWRSPRSDPRRKARPELRQPAGAARDRSLDRARRDVRAHRTRWRRQDDVLPDRRGPSRADVRPRFSRGRAVRDGAAALLAVRGPHGGREPRAPGPALLRAARRERRAREGPPLTRRSRPLLDAPRGRAVGWNEAEARARRGAPDAARAPPPRRADDGRRPRLAPRVLASPERPPPRGAHDRRLDALHGRGRVRLAPRLPRRGAARGRRDARRDPRGLSGRQQPPRWADAGRRLRFLQQPEWRGWPRERPADSPPLFTFQEIFVFLFGHPPPLRQPDPQVRRLHRRRPRLVRDPPQEGVRLPRPERVGQVHDDPDADGAPQAHVGHGDRLWRPRRGEGHGGLEEAPRIHEPEVLALHRPHRRGKPALFRVHLWSFTFSSRRPRRRARVAPALRATPRGAHGEPLDRPAPARRARGGPAPRAGAPLPRRADRWRGPEGAAPLLGPRHRSA